MAHRKKPEEPEKPQNSERWLLTYSDMITLLMVFFVVLFAMSKVDTKKFEALAESLSLVFQGLPGIQLLEGSGGHAVIEGTGGPPRPPPGTGLSPRISPMRQIFLEKATSTLATEIQTGKIQMNTEARGIVLSLSGDTFFRPGEATIAEGSMPSLVKVGQLLNSVQEKIVVEGYTDDSPVDRTSLYKSNLMLSAVRAVNVVEALDLIGVDKNRMSATGFGDTNPERPNDTPEGRAYNRRVDILILFPTE
ncbi:MAG: flagellar motor protein MotB [Treponema sp.]|nr:flagellar motor protein MotB [Treponema sp.]